MKVSQLKDGRWEFDSGEIKGTRTRRIFDTQAEAEVYLRKAKNTAKDEGARTLIEWLSIAGNELVEIIKYRREMIEVNGKPDWEKGHELHLAHLTAATTGGLLGNLRELYIERKRKAGRDEEYLKRLDRELEKFEIAHIGLTAADITDAHIDRYLDKLGQAGVTRSNSIRDLRGLFSFAKKKNACSVNPAELTEPVKIVKKRAKIFTLQEVAVILWVSDHHPEWELTPYLTFGLFGSARVCEAFRLDWDAYIEEECALILEAAATKKNQERVTENLPPVLLDWIKPYIKSSGPLSPPESTVEWRRAHYLIPAIRKILPHFVWRKNGLRKTSISAAYALTKDAKAVAADHGTSPEMIFSTYRAVMRTKDAAQYPQLTRNNITKYLRGLVPDEELDAWDRKYSALASTSPSAVAPPA